MILVIEMINRQSRQEDLTKVFDRTWNANHNDVAKRGREKERKFMNKMFNIKEDNTPQNKILTPGERAVNLQNNINSTASFQKQTQINNIIKKWK